MDRDKTNSEFAKLSAYEFRNYLGLTSIAVLQWEKGRSGGSIHLELTAEQCVELSARLLDQARVRTH